MKQFKIETGEHHLHVDPGHRRHQHVACVEHPLQHGEGPLPWSPPPVDAPVPEPVPHAQPVASDPAPHGGVEAPGLDAEVALVTVDHLTLPGQVDLAVVDRGRRRLQVPDEAVVYVGLGVELVAEDGPTLPLGPGAVPAPAGPGPVAPRLPGRLAGVGCDERGVLDDALLHPEALRVQLALQLLPHQPVPAGFGEALPELPHRRVVGQGLREAEEALEADAVGHLALQLRVAEPVPLLEHQKLHHHHLVHVRPASLGALVVVEALDDGAEGLTVYEGLDPGESVAQLPDLLVCFSKHVGLEGVHVFWIRVVI